MPPRRRRVELILLLLAGVTALGLLLARAPRAPAAAIVPASEATPPPVASADAVLRWTATDVPSPTADATGDAPTATALLESSSPAAETDDARRAERLDGPTGPTDTSTPAPVPPSPLGGAPTLPVAPPVAPAPYSGDFLRDAISRLYDLSRLPVPENSVAMQFTSQRRTGLVHYFDYFVDDGSFVGGDYGYTLPNGATGTYRIVTGYDGAREYEIVPRTPGPGYIARIWFANQQADSVNNPVDESQNAEWYMWGNLGSLGNIRFYFDDSPVPQIDMPIKNLFAGNYPFLRPLAMFYRLALGGTYTYVPIPFSRSVRVTLTGRPRLMQIEVKRVGSPPFPATRAPANYPADVLRAAANAWAGCTAALRGETQRFNLSLPHNTTAEVDLDTPATISSLRVHVPRLLDDSAWMQVFWDGDPSPSLQGPLRGLFGKAEQLFPYHALPLGIDDDGATLTFYNNLPMPYQSARIVFINNRAETLPLTLETVLAPTLPGTENSRLHAFFNRAQLSKQPDDSGNYVLVDTAGAGKYLGTILSAYNLDRRALNGPIAAGWRFPYLESNLNIWLDGVPALPGTGIEDDFNGAFYYLTAADPGTWTHFCLSGVTQLDFSTPTQPASQYRFYLDDAPEFHNRLRIEVQHGNDGNNLSVTYSSTAFWYEYR